MATGQHPSPVALRKLSAFSDLDADVIDALARKLTVSTARKGSALIERGSNEPAMLYLLDGEITLKAADGGVRRISANDPSATTPIARLRPSRYDVIANSLVSYLWVDDAITESVNAGIDNMTSMLTNIQVEEETPYGDMTSENQLTVQLYQDLNEDQLLLPSLPDVAVRIGQVVNDEYSDATKVARVIETDPAISAKMLKAANSARFGGAQHVASVKDAVARVGMKNTHYLVISFALRELFHSRSPTLMKRMQDLWQHSRQIAAISHVLAKKCGKLNTDEAMLAGLVHDIGVLAVLGYARDFPDVANDAKLLEHSITSMRAQLGKMILSRWQLPAELTEAAVQAENWRRTHPGNPDYADLVIIAQAHALQESEGVIPSLDTIPAYEKCGFASQDSENGGRILEEAAEEIREAEELLGG